MARPASRPFRVSFQPASEQWLLYGRHHCCYLGAFSTAGEAIDFAYKKWPWWS